MTISDPGVENQPGGACDGAAAGGRLTARAGGGRVYIGPIESYIRAMLRLSKKADYGLIALLHLAAKETRPSASAKEIAETYGLPLPLLAKVLQTLTRRGFLAAAYGTNGGYRLARRAESISALEVIDALDGPVVLTSCTGKANGCDRNSKCTARGPLEKIREDILQLLERTSLSEMRSTPSPKERLVRLAASRTNA